MTNIITRIVDSISNDLHDLIDKKEAENPIKSLNMYLRQSEQEKEKVRKMIERQYRLKDEFTREYHKAEDLANKRLRQAEIAKEANEETLYEYAMREHEDYRQRADRLKDAREEAVMQLEQLEEKYEKMKYKLKDMHLKRMELMGRENVARFHHKINQVMEESLDKSYSRFGELEQFIERLEYKVNTDYERHTFDSKIANLEKELQKNKERNTVDNSTN